MDQQKRRRFFGLIGGATAAAAAVVAVKAPQAQVGEELASTQQAAESKTGYQLTEHVRRYYETTLS
jgi:hypothetical protein